MRIIMLLEIACPNSLDGQSWKDRKDQGLVQGLYVFLFENRQDRDVFDANKTPKIVVHGHGISLKSGKFEQTLTTRLANYEAHLHVMAPHGQRQYVFQATFVRGYVLDLSSRDTLNSYPLARIFERFWVEEVNRFLVASSLLSRPPQKQIARSEWRYLRTGALTTETTERLKNHLESVAKTIDRMQTAISASATANRD
jgi:hypothetical protein